MGVPTVASHGWRRAVVACGCTVCVCFPWSVECTWHSSRALSGQIGNAPCCPLKCTCTHIPHEEVLGRSVVVALWTARLCRTRDWSPMATLFLDSQSQLPSEFSFLFLPRFACWWNERSEPLRVFNVANHFQAQDIRSVLRHTSTEVSSQEHHLRIANKF